MTKIKPGKYKHFKGDMVEVIGQARHSETLEDFVVYRHLTGQHAGEKHYWVRPVKMFLEKVSYHGKRTPRFKFIN